MHFSRHFTSANKPVAEQITWKAVRAFIPGTGVDILIEVPEGWSQTATNILAKNYLRKAGVPTNVYHTSMHEVGNKYQPPGWLHPSIPDEDATFGPETSARQVFHRLAGHWTYVGWKHKYFDSEADAQVFYDEIFWMLAHQIAAPNSPQFFNTGLWWAYGITGPASGQWTIDYASGEPYETTSAYQFPQPHACFIQPVSDDLVNPGGIMDLWVREVRLFKQGSGTGTNFSSIRGRGEPLSGGGVSSGLMSFLRIGDVAAGAIASGGTTRRAAKMVCLDLDHPEIEDFINWKVREERKARALVAGSGILNDGGEVYSSVFEGEAISTVSGQNSNNSVRITDEFLRKVDADEPWDLWPRSAKKVGVGTPTRTLSSRSLWHSICAAAHASADPGIQFHDTINAWHTCAADGEINASNPCCFVAGTLVDTSEGLIDIAELERMCTRGEQLPHAFSFDKDTTLPKLSPITNAWVAGFTQHLVDIYLDSGEVFRCTPEHKWLTRTGQYIEAQRLRPGTSLRKIGRFVNRQRSDRCCILHRCTEEVPNGTVYQSRWMWEQVKGKIPPGFEIHHLNDDTTDDRISNFELKPELDHRSYHSAGKNNPRFIEIETKVLVEIYDSIAANRRNKTRGPTVTPGLWNIYIRKNDLVGIIPQAQSPTTGGRIQGMLWDEFIIFIESARSEVNAKVVKIEMVILEEPEAVYDLEIEGTHNFGIRSNYARNEPSVVVSNSEYMFLDNTACNLASINLVSCLMGRPSKAGDLDLVSFEHATRLWTIVLDISVTMASFPSREIALGSYNYRTLGLGYANLGGLLMRLGLAYDSDEGRALAAALTALMHGVAYLTSSEMAKELGPFPRWKANAESMRKVVLKHGQEGDLNKWPQEIQDRNVKVWEQILKVETLVGGFRNAQVTLLAPTGTISFVMDCDTTGVEPDFALKRTKQLAGGGAMELVNESVGPALIQLGYKAHQRNLILAYINQNGTAEGCPDLSPEHLPVFDCANAPEGFTRTLAPMAHVKMVAAVQPFLSGAVSKTVNLPNSATVEDVSQIYREAHRLGLKAVALYREGSKMTQPLKAGGKGDDSGNRIHAATQEEMTERIVPRWPIPAGLARGERERLPTRCSGYCQKFRIDGHAVYVHTGEYPDGRLGQIFIEMSDEGSTLRALANALAKAVSLGIQFGTPPEEYVEAFVAARFEPAGIVEGHESIKICSSVLSAIFRDLGIHYFGREDLANLRVSEEPATSPLRAVGAMPTPRLSGQFCSCGSLMVRTGPCLTCSACGNTTGCG